MSVRLELIALDGNKERKTHVVEVHIEHSKERKWIALNAISFDSSPNCWLGENKLRELIYEELLSVALQELRKESLDSVEVDFGVGVEEFERDIDKALPVRSA